MYFQHGPVERAQMEYDNEASSEGFLSHFEGLSLTGKGILDLGCGYGGRTVRYKELGAKSVAGIEVMEDPVLEALAFSKLKRFPILAAVGFAEALPFSDESFDLIFSYDVFEHVENLRLALSECHRTLKRGGSLCAVFPPFYHPTGGSHLHGYVSSSPAPHLIFSCGTLRKAIYEILGERNSGYVPFDRPTDPLPSVNGTTFGGFLKLLKTLSFSSASITSRPLRAPVFMNPIIRLGSRIPILREVCTSRIVCELKR